MQSKTTHNTYCREYAKQKKVCLWQVGEMLGYSCDAAFSRKLRRELTEEEKSAFIKAVDYIAKEQGAAYEKKP